MTVEICGGPNWFAHWGDQTLWLPGAMWNGNEFVAYKMWDGTKWLLSCTAAPTPVNWIREGLPYTHTLSGDNYRGFISMAANGFQFTNYTFTDIDLSKYGEMSFNGMSGGYYHFDVYGVPFDISEPNSGVVRYGFVQVESESAFAILWDDLTISPAVETAQFNRRCRFQLVMWENGRVEFNYGRMQVDVCLDGCNYGPYIAYDLPDASWQHEGSDQPILDMTSIDPIFGVPPVQGQSGFTTGGQYDLEAVGRMVMNFDPPPPAVAHTVYTPDPTSVTVDAQQYVVPYMEGFPVVASGVESERHGGFLHCESFNGYAGESSIMSLGPGIAPGSQGSYKITHTEGAFGYPNGVEARVDIYGPSGYRPDWETHPGVSPMNISASLWFQLLNVDATNAADTMLILKGFWDTSGSESFQLKLDYNGGGWTLDATQGSQPPIQLPELDGVNVFVNEQINHIGLSWEWWDGTVVVTINGTESRIYNNSLLAIPLGGSTWNSQQPNFDGKVVEAYFFASGNLTETPSYALIDQFKVYTNLGWKAYAQPTQYPSIYTPNTTTVTVDEFNYVLPYAVGMPVLQSANYQEQMGGMMYDVDGNPWSAGNPVQPGATKSYQVTDNDDGWFGPYLEVFSPIGLPDIRLGPYWPTATYLRFSGWVQVDGGQITDPLYPDQLQFYFYGRWGQDGYRPIWFELYYHHRQWYLDQYFDISRPHLNMIITEFDDIDPFNRVMFMEFDIQAITKTMTITLNDRTWQYTGPEIWPDNSWLQWKNQTVTNHIYPLELGLQGYRYSPASTTVTSRMNDLRIETDVLWKPF